MAPEELLPKARMSVLGGVERIGLRCLDLHRAVDIFIATMCDKDKGSRSYTEDT